MGLAEKRIVKAYQDDSFKNHVKEINSILGKDVDIKVDWNSLSNNSYSNLWEDSFTKIYFKPIIYAFRSITSDEMGKEALQESLNAIEIQDVEDISNASSAYTFEGGVLKIDHSSYLNMDQVEERSNKLTEILESGL